MADSACKYIGTHSGQFHADESLAVALLKMLPEFKAHRILRSRNPALLEKCDVLVDVGATYDASTRRFDHHQRSFSEVFSSTYKTVKLSSAGLVYKHFGERVVETLHPELPAETISEVHAKFYAQYVEHFDGIDNGVNAFNGERVYRTTSDASSRVARLNPRWNETDVDPNALFEKAVELTGAEFVDALDHLVKGWLPAKNTVMHAVSASLEVDASGRILVLHEFCPWNEHLNDLQDSRGVDPKSGFLFVLYPENKGDPKGRTRIQCVPDPNDSFVSLKPIKEAWRGLRDEELSAKSGIAGCVFVHAAGFIGGNQTFEGALKMARAQLDE